MDMHLRQSPVSPSPSKQQRTPLGTLANGNSAKKLAADLNDYLGAEH
jgi:hypothetical protein